MFATRNASSPRTGATPPASRDRLRTVERSATASRRPRQGGLLLSLAGALRALVRSPARARRRRLQERRVRVLGRVAIRPGTPPESRRFLGAALARQARIVTLLQTLGVAEDLFLDWREGILVVLEREAALARRLERVRARLRGPLPTTVVEERLLARVAAGRGGDDATALHARADLLEELDRLLSELESPGPSLVAG